MLGWVFEGRIGQATGNRNLFLFCQPLPIKFIPQHPQSNLLQSPYSNYLWPPPLPLKLLHLNFKKSQSDKPILSNHSVSDLSPADVIRAKWKKVGTWLMKDCWMVHLSTNSSKTMSLHNKAKLPDSFTASFRFTIIFISKGQMICIKRNIKKNVWITY